MNKRIHKIIGVAFTGILLASMALGLAVPASAGTLSWSTESIPSTSGNLLAAVSANDFAVSSDGATIYAVVGTTAVYKSTNGGTSWSTVGATLTAVTLISVAPDDANVVVAVNGAAPAVYVSTNGGTSWSDLNSAASTFVTTTIKTVDISAALSGVRNIAIGGVTGTAADAAYFNLGSTVPGWTDIVPWTATSPDGLSAVVGLKFSPNFAADRVMVAVTESQDTPVVGTDTVFFDIVSFASKMWNNTAGFGDYDGALNVIINDTLGLVSPLQKAAISMAPTYLGADEGSRISFVGIATAATDTTVQGGVYRMTDETDKLISSATRINSVGYNGTNLVAGAFDSNSVYRSADPMVSSPSVSSATLRQRPGIDTTAFSEQTIVAWSGANVVAATRGVSSAFAVSMDNGTTFNDVSLINTTLAVIEDLAVTPDGSKIYLVSNDATDLSLWRKDGSWQRILTLPLTTAYNIIRIAPDNASIIYLADFGGTTVYYTNDGGEKSWTLRAAGVTIQDLAVESASVVYALNAAGSVSKSTDAGFIWGSAKATGLASGYSIRSVSAGNLIVGGAAGNVAYSTDGNSNWTKISGTMAAGAGNVIVASNGSLATDGNIFAGVSTVNDYIYRWTIGQSSSDWKKISVQLAATEYTAGIAFSDGALYAVVTGDAVSPAGGGSTLYRSINPTASTPSFSTAMAGATVAASPDFTNAGATTVAGTAINNLAVTTGSNKVWAIDADAVAADESTTDTVTDEVYSYTDTLYNAAPTQTGPTNAGTIQMNPVTGRAYDVAFTWDRPSEATKYNVTVALDSGFTQTLNTWIVTSSSTNVALILGPFTSGTTSSGTANLELMPEVTYYWRVKVASDGPVASPNSATWSFKIAPALQPPPASVVPLELLAPAQGATSVPIQPTFSWTAIPGATKYELQAAKDAAFADRWISKTGNVPLLTNVWLSEFELEYSTTYYWRVRAFAAGKFGDWTVGIFTTVPKPEPPVVTTPPPPPAPPVEVVQEFITPAYIWAIIGIGAALVIVVIILIVRTRRVP